MSVKTYNKYNASNGIAQKICSKDLPEFFEGTRQNKNCISPRLL